jgi:hypothetical protein
VIWADWTTDELKGFRKKLSKAIATGAQDVAYGDRRVRYTSVKEMHGVLNGINAEIDRREGTSRTKQILVRGVKGFT